MNGNLVMTDSPYGKTISFSPYTIYTIPNKLKTKCKKAKVENFKFISI